MRGPRGEVRAPRRQNLKRSSLWASPISCRNRHCPKCQGAAARIWLAEREADLLPVGYFHVVFTLPTEVADIAFHSKAVVYDLLFRAASETMMTIAADPKHLGARIGITAVLHTWGSAMTHHPHIHMIVPGGGISLDGTRWVSSRPAFLLPVRVLSKLFRRLFLTRLLELHAAGRLAFFGDHAGLREERAFLRLIARLRKKKWVVYAKPPFAGPEAVLAYVVALHAPRRHLQQPAGRPRRTAGHASAGRITCAVKAREVEHEVVKTSRALLIFDRRLQCRPPV